MEALDLFYEYFGSIPFCPLLTNSILSNIGVFVGYSTWKGWFVLNLSTFLPLKVAGTDTFVQCRRGPHVLVVTVDNQEMCHPCHKCPPGKGMSIKCAGQIVESTVNVECLNCVLHFNHSSTNDYQQCLRCPNVCTNKETEGECGPEGDDRRCIPCKDGWYFDQVHEKCLLCSCQNMSAQAKQKCSSDGVSFEQCRTATTKPTNPGQSHQEHNTKGWDTSSIMQLISGSIALILFFIYLYCVGSKVCKFRENNSRWPHAGEWNKLILCYPHCVTNSASPTAGIASTTGNRNEVAVHIDCK